MDIARRSGAYRAVDRVLLVCVPERIDYQRRHVLDAEQKHFICRRPRDAGKIIAKPTHDRSGPRTDRQDSGAKWQGTK